MTEMQYGNVLITGGSDEETFSHEVDIVSNETSIAFPGFCRFGAGPVERLTTIRVGRISNPGFSPGLRIRLSGCWVACFAN
jgi:hypothetical protein